MVPLRVSQPKVYPLYLLPPLVTRPESPLHLVCAENRAEARESKPWTSILKHGGTCGSVFLVLCAVVLKETVKQLDSDAMQTD